MHWMWIGCTIDILCNEEMFRIWPCVMQCTSIAMINLCVTKMLEAKFDRDEDKQNDTEFKPKPDDDEGEEKKDDEANEDNSDEDKEGRTRTR